MERYRLNYAVNMPCPNGAGYRQEGVEISLAMVRRELGKSIKIVMVGPLEKCHFAHWSKIAEWRKNAMKLQVADRKILGK